MGEGSLKGNIPYRGILRLNKKRAVLSCFLDSPLFVYRDFYLNTTTPISPERSSGSNATPEAKT
jgi:hypothetical protein